MMMAACAVSEAGVMKLVEIRLGYQRRFDNSSDTPDAIWKHIHSDFIHEVNIGRPESQVLGQRWARLWARHEASGVVMAAQRRPAKYLVSFRIRLAGRLHEHAQRCRTNGKILSQSPAELAKHTRRRPCILSGGCISRSCGGSGC